ncbi:putative S15 family peptidase-like protein [Streptomyces microflavus DSM 40593]|uniref:Putative S15 family peptidase-like protein n=1 Tax=Streptomyces microflavus DSM 40593 TaxID=1303692 RepID=N0D3E1_STRMI|nr:putative S15 family peptidase-like protein [Streptomyces microflavus DSM 40593]
MVVRVEPSPGPPCGALPYPVPPAAAAEGDHASALGLQRPCEGGAGPPYVQRTEVDAVGHELGPVRGEAVAPRAEEQAGGSAPAAPQCHGVLGEGVAGAADGEEREAGGGAAQDDPAARALVPEAWPGGQGAAEAVGQPGDREVFQEPGVVGEGVGQGVGYGVRAVAVRGPPAGPGPQPFGPRGFAGGLGEAEGGDGGDDGVGPCVTGGAERGDEGAVGGVGGTGGDDGAATAPHLLAHPGHGRGAVALLVFPVWVPRSR